MKIILSFDDVIGYHGKEKSSGKRPLFETFLGADSKPPLLKKNNKNKNKKIRWPLFWSSVNPPEKGTYRG